MDDKTSIESLVYILNKEETDPKFFADEELNIKAQR